ncbi:MAG: THUMP domain-containing protein, partial [SAR324 cluster bacterium]|nr:THUMP domain-containing protein [SAR324 cluster bacterium]
MSHFFVTCAKGLELLLVQELETLGAESCKMRTAGVAVCGSLETAYRSCLWSRIASRVLWPLTEVAAPDADTLYSALQAFPWEEHFTVDQTFAVHSTALRSPISNTHYAALRVKDAVVDRFRDFVGRRPNVDPEAP